KTLKRSRITNQALIASEINALHISRVDEAFQPLNLHTNLLKRTERPVRNGREFVARQSTCARHITFDHVLRHDFSFHRGSIQPLNWRRERGASRALGYPP